MIFPKIDAETLCREPFYLRGAKEGLRLAGGLLQANSDPPHYQKHIFQLRPKASAYQIYSLNYETPICAVGEGWRMENRVTDENWTFFDLEINGNTVAFISTHPLAGRRYLGLVGSDRFLCIAHNPRTEWDNFIPEPARLQFP